ncbi:hypothetical protein JMJ78_0000872 [Colletotrichum scovillei]|nr:hypothetical protein JMJ78_0000872 [Colletotrichum scovillei]
MHRVDAFHIFACFRMTNPPMSTSFRSHQYPAQRRFSHPGSLQSAVELHCLAKSTLNCKAMPSRGPSNSPWKAVGHPLKPQQLDNGSARPRRRNALDDAPEC